MDGLTNHIQRVVRVEGEEARAWTEVPCCARVSPQFLGAFEGAESESEVGLSQKTLVRELSKMRTLVVRDCTDRANQTSREERWARAGFQQLSVDRKRRAKRSGISYLSVKSVETGPSRAVITLTTGPRCRAVKPRHRPLCISFEFL